MESYPFKLSAAVPSITIPSQGDLFVYESAEASPRANLLGYSEQFDAAAWQKTNVTAVANAVAAPDGTAFADKITGTAAGWWTRQSAIPVEPGTEYTASVWMRTTTPGRVDLYIVDTGVVSLACDVTTEWQRFRITYRATSGNAAFQIGASAFGRDIFVFGAMFEKGPNMGPYIPSPGAGVAYGPGEGRIRVKPDTGGEIVLRPGQRYRTPERTTRWTIRPYGAETLEGWLIIGEGDFDDANTKNSVKLDATFANVVTVANDVNARVPVSLDPNQLFQQTNPVMAYTNSKSNINIPSGGTWFALITAAENTTGIIIEQLLTTVPCFMSAKATIPATLHDGDMLSLGTQSTDTTRRKVAAGKAVWLQKLAGDDGDSGCAVDRSVMDRTTLAAAAVGLLLAYDTMRQTAGTAGDDESNIIFDGIDQLSSFTNGWPTGSAPYAELITSSALANNVPPAILAWLLWKESRYSLAIINGTRRSSVGAMGIAQFMPATARQWLGSEAAALDPQKAIPGAARYLAKLYSMTGSWTEALAAYNWGIGNVQRKGIDAAPAETRDYYTSILSKAGGIWA